jgi:predicted  nucleic acid-binding Zn-ribbon protein
MENASNASASHLTLAASKDKVVAVNAELTQDFDELDHQVLRHRTELQTLDTQISKLEEAIDLDQRQLRDVKDALAERIRVRARLLVVRGAMSRFVQGLQTRDGR